MECGCGCENLLPLRTFERGWRYLRGHKPKAEKPLGGGILRRPREKPAPVAQASYALTLEMVRENLAAVHARMDTLREQEEAAVRRVEEIRDQRAGCGEEAAKLRNAECALRPFVEQVPAAQEAAA